MDRFADMIFLVTGGAGGLGSAIARAVLFLADPANGAVTGIALPVDVGNL